jgi:hypothetical protein
MPTTMARPDNRSGDRRPAVYARLAAQVDRPDELRAPAPWVRWVGWALAIAMVVVAMVAVTAWPG